MITKVFTPNILYTIEVKVDLLNSSRIILNECKIEQTTYGSVIIKRKNRATVELYPSSISHIIHL